VAVAGPRATLPVVLQNMDRAANFGKYKTHYSGSNKTILSMNTFFIIKNPKAECSWSFCNRPKIPQNLSAEITLFLCNISSLFKKQMDY
jgi:hypothetical protein